MHETIHDLFIYIISFNSVNESFSLQYTAAPYWTTVTCNQCLSSIFYIYTLFWSITLVNDNRNIYSLFWLYFDPLINNSHMYLWRQLKMGTFTSALSLCTVMSKMYWAAYCLNSQLSTKWANEIEPHKWLIWKTKKRHWTNITSLMLLIKVCIIELCNT